ncbi:MAG: ribonuclease D [Alphaproteobacteria bacterium]|nr:ribonuclease D [Alphaproteobacteria bacterium]
MNLITESEPLAAFAKRAAKAEFITVDTEFLRDKTYWPKLCLIQIATPEEAVAVDTLAPDVDLGPVLKLLLAPKPLKVFHAARQDIEIFHRLSGKVPAPLFDTQIAAMVCGFGEAVSYESLASRLAKARIDKTMRFTDWARRPLTKKQLDYAIADVTHLRLVYQKLSDRLEKSGRTEWVAEELAKLTDPETYTIDPQESWRRIRSKGSKPRYLAVLRGLAAWREREAQRRDIPRSRVMRDETIAEIAAHAPTTLEELAALRSATGEHTRGRVASEIIAIVNEALNLPEDALPRVPSREENLPNAGPSIELMKVLLKLKCEMHGVAQKLVATSDDIEALARDDEADVPALHGWRRELFGEDALALKHGRIALTTNGMRLKVVPIER